MNISPVRLNAVKPVFRGLTKRASEKLISFSENLSPADERKCLAKIYVLAKRLEESNTDVDYGNVYAEVSKNKMSYGAGGIRKVLFEGLKITDKSNPNEVKFLPVRNFYTNHAEVKIDNGGVYSEIEGDRVKTKQYYGLYSMNFGEFMDVLNEQIDKNEGLISDKLLGKNELKASILAHSK